MMGTIFEWDDSAERSGHNRISACTSAQPGGLVLIATHAGTGVSVSVPRYAVEAMRDALTDHLEAASPAGVIREVLANRSFSTTAETADALVAALREAGHIT